MEQAVRLASAVDPLLLVQLGRMYLELDDPLAAEIRADQALKLENQLPAAWSLKGDIFCRAGDTSQALRAYQQALSLAPDDYECRMAMARIYLASGRPLRAVNTLSQLEGRQAHLRDPGEYWELYGTGLLALGRADEAAEALVQSLPLRRPSASLLSALVQAYGDSGQPEQAERTAELARQILPPQQWPQFSSVVPSSGDSLPQVASRPR
jgi:tetratricopeptide (TPR) repeat protein